MNTGQSNRRGPQVLLAAGGLGHVGRTDEQAAGFVGLFLFRPGLVRDRLEAQRGSQHAGGQVFGHVGGLLGLHAVIVDLAEVAPLAGVAGDGHADGRGNEPAVLVGFRAGHHAESDRPRRE